MSSVRLSTHILHNPKRPERVSALARLYAQISIATVESGPGPENEFNERRWRNALAFARANRCTHCVLLDDDVIVCPNFDRYAQMIVEARPSEVIALHTSLPSARAAYDVGEHWLTSLDGVLGSSNIWPVRVLEEFLAWRSSSALKPGTVEASGRFGSDALAGMFCAETGRRVFHPIPTIVMHDLSLETNFAGNEATPGRQTTCNFSEVPLPDNWEQSSPVRHTGGWFLGMPGLRAAYCKRSAQEPQITDTGVWFGENVAQHHACDPGLAEWLGGFLYPSRQVFDLGCGDGAYLAALARKGFTKLLGIDGTALPDRVFYNVIAHDLTHPIDVLPEARGDVLCLEVCEHVPAEYEGRLLDNITGACGEHGRVVLSWAVRGQHGHGHVNCRDSAEVIPLFEARGFEFLELETREARAAARTLPWFALTILIFQRRSSAQTTQPGGCPPTSFGVQEAAPVPPVPERGEGASASAGPERAVIEARNILNANATETLTEAATRVMSRLQSYESFANKLCGAIHASNQIAARGPASEADDARRLAKREARLLIAARGTA